MGAPESLKEAPTEGRAPTHHKSWTSKRLARIIAHDVSGLIFQAPSYGSALAPGLSSAREAANPKSIQELGAHARACLNKALCDPRW